MAYIKEVIVASENSRRMKFRKDFEFELANATATLKKFAGDILGDDPLYHAKWADSMFMAAAKHNVAKRVIHLLEHLETVEEIRENLMEGIRNKSRYIFNKSTSPSGNYGEECYLSAVSEAYDKFEYVEDLDGDYFKGKAK